MESKLLRPVRRPSFYYFCPFSQPVSHVCLPCTHCIWAELFVAPWLHRAFFLTAPPAQCPTPFSSLNFLLMTSRFSSGLVSLTGLGAQDPATAQRWVWCLPRHLHGHHYPLLTQVDRDNGYIYWVIIIIMFQTLCHISQHCLFNHNHIRRPV